MDPDSMKSTPTTIKPDWRELMEMTYLRRWSCCLSKDLVVSEYLKRFSLTAMKRY